MSLDERKTIEPLAETIHAVHRFGNVDGKSFAVFGACLIWILVAQVARGLITNISDLRLQKAKECRVDFVANTLQKDFGEALVESFGPMSGQGRCGLQNRREWHPMVSTITLIAVFAKMSNIDLAVLNDHELDLNTTMMYRNEEYNEVIRLVNEALHIPVLPEGLPVHR